MKDPSFLFYSNDFMSGTMFMTDEQVGKYIRLMCAQHQHGHLSEKYMLFICKSYDKIIFEKFIQDSDGLYFNVRLDEEINRRKKYSESRSINKKGKKKDKIICKSYDNHMENENENENEIVNKEKKGVTGERKTTKKPKNELSYPFSSDEFISTWNILVSTPKWKKKIPHSLQLALNSLGKYEEDFAVELIEKAIEGNWQGVTFTNTPDDYQKWLKRNRNGKNNEHSQVGAKQDFLEAIANGIGRAEHQRNNTLQ